MTLKEYIQQNPKENNRTIAKRIPCARQYIGMIANGKKRPSYKMACIIEKITDGKVKKSNWYD